MSGPSIAPVTMREPDHPICQGLPETWLHAYDEYHALGAIAALGVGRVAHADDRPNVL